MTFQRNHNAWTVCLVVSAASPYAISLWLMLTNLLCACLPQSRTRVKTCCRWYTCLHSVGVLGSPLRFCITGSRVPWVGPFGFQICAPSAMFLSYAVL